MSSDDPRTSELQFTPAAESALDSIRRLVVPTDVPGVDCVDVARHAAGLAAADRRVEIVLYDRSAETWMDHPHPSGPFGADELSDDFAELARQLRDLESRGVEARGWISTVPSLTEIATAVEQTNADGVLLPEPSCDRTLADRLTGRRDPNADVSFQIESTATSPVTVLVVDGGVVDVMVAADRAD